MKVKPSISVIMAVYNTKESYLKEAIESILQQTFTDFEFIIICDCPTDNSTAIVRSYASSDKRIFVIENNQNIGLTKSLNKGIRVSRGQYLARMDADDIAMSERLKIQYQFMESHPDVIVLGSRVKTTDNNRIAVSTFLPDQDVLRIRMLFANCGVPHPTAFLRKSFLIKEHLLYDENYPKSQDYKLWIDILERNGQMVLLHEVLLMYRIHDKQISEIEGKTKYPYSLSIACDNLTKLLGSLTSNEIDLVRTIRMGILPNNDTYALSSFFTKIIDVNSKLKKYDHCKLKRELTYIWILKSLRRIKHCGKFDMVFCSYFKIWHLEIIKYFIYNYIKKNGYSFKFNL